MKPDAATDVDAPPSADPPSDRLSALLARPDDQRLREYKYRFSQAAVFGLPVLALQLWGRALGGSDSDRWVGILQALLAGWVVYVGAAGMLFEGLILLSRRVIADLIPALVAVLAYLFSLISVLHVLLTGQLWYRPLLFHVSVIIVTAWTGLQWYRWSKRSSSLFLEYRERG